jgi:simple sugar transport system ATP-binding protein
MISQDLDEILEISDRIAVMANGRLSRARARADLPREAIGLMMTGIGMASTREAALAH